MWNWVELLSKFRAAAQPVALVTVTSCTGSTPRDTGAKMVVLPDGRFFGTIGGGQLEQLAIEDARLSLERNESRTVRYPLGAKAGQCCGGVVELLMEVLNAGPKLYLFGAGHVGQAVCKTLAGTAFEVHVIDEREQWVQAPELPADTIRHEEDWELFVDKAIWDAETTHVAIMTCRHDVDEAILARVLDHPCAYLGLIGSRAKWGRFQQRLTARGVSPEKLSRVKCPIGIGLAGKAPQEIAVSVAAELLGTYYGNVPTASALDSARGREIHADA